MRGPCSIAVSRQCRPCILPRGSTSRPSVYTVVTRSAAKPTCFSRSHGLCFPYLSVCLSVYLSSVCVCVCVCLSVCHIRRTIMSTFVFCVRMAIYHWYRSLLVCTPVCHTSVFSRHIHNFCRAMHMHSADYTVTTCLSDRLSI